MIAGLRNVHTMQRVLVGLLLVWCVGFEGRLIAQQTLSGVISESHCGASHQAMAQAGSMTERECAFHCLNRLATYVLVDDQKKVIPIANQDFAGLPLRLARPVRVTGAMTDKGLVISRIELPLVHAHIARTPVPPHEVDARVPRPVSEIVMKLLAKTAEARYQSALGLAADLERCLQELAATGQPLVPTHVSFPAAGRVAVTRDVFRWVPAYWVGPN